jgi:hypothetical protein
MFSIEINVCFVPEADIALAAQLLARSPNCGSLAYSSSSCYSTAQGFVMLDFALPEIAASAATIRRGASAARGWGPRAR